MALDNLFKGLVPGLVTGKAGVGMAKDITQQGNELNAELKKMGLQSQADMAFKGYGVTTGLGNTTVGPDGSTVISNTGAGTIGMPEYQQGIGNIQNAVDMAQQNRNPYADQSYQNIQAANQGMLGAQGTSLGAANQFTQRSLQGVQSREQDIYNRMMAAQQPGMDRARSSMAARAQAQGRGGLAGSQYGGSGEQFALSRAEAEARNSAMLGAMAQAGSEQMNQAKIAQGYGQMGNAFSNTQGSQAGMMSQMGLGNAELIQAGAGLTGQLGAQQGKLGLDAYGSSFTPLQMQLQAQQQAAQNANMSQTGQISGANMNAQLGLGGSQVNVNATKAASELYGNMFGALAQPLSDVGSWIDSLF